MKLYPEFSADRWWAMLSFLWILFLLPLFARRESDFVMFYAKQGLVLFLFETVVTFLRFVPMLGLPLYFIGMIFSIIVSGLGMIHCYYGETWEAPLIGKYSRFIKIKI